MNSYPFGVPGLLLPPPPPPSQPPPPTPPAASVLDHGLIGKTSDFRGPFLNENTSISPQNQHHQQCGLPNHPQSTMHLQNFLPSHGINNMPNNPTGMISHLSLPPPPPPPPPAIEAPLSGSEQFRVGNHLLKSSPTSNYTGCTNQRSPHMHGKPRPYRGGPPQWAPHQKQFPTGLQGPWKIPKVPSKIDWTPEMGQSIPQGQQSPGVPGISPATFQHMQNPAHCYSVSDQDGESTAAINVVPSTDSTSSSHMGVETTDSALPKCGALTPSATTYKDHKVNPKDPRLPKELTDLFEALHCKLCEVVSSSNVQAKLHYSGKPHEKKVRHWLLKWSEETGNPPPKRPRLDTQVVIDPQDLYCKLCEVAFTSIKHSEQHKMGKPHQKALRLGYSNPKMKSKKVAVPMDPSGRFGIGDGFKKGTSNDCTVQLVDAKQNFPVSTLTSAPKNSTLNNKFFCDLCQISTTSQEHLDSHYAGAKHRKALVHAARSEVPETSVVPPPVEPAESILASVIGHNDVGSSRVRCISEDLSIFRTPSGQFYCHPCNTTVNSEKSFKEHTESKRHKFKVASSKRS